MVSSEKVKQHLFIFSYVVDKKDYGQRWYFHQRASQEFFDSEFVRTEIGRITDEDVFLKPRLGHTYFSRNIGSCKVIQYSITEEGSPLLEAPEFREGNV